MKHYLITGSIGVGSVCARHSLSTFCTLAHSSQQLKSRSISSILQMKKLSEEKLCNLTDSPHVVCDRWISDTVLGAGDGYKLYMACGLMELILSNTLKWSHKSTKHDGYKAQKGNGMVRDQEPGFSCGVDEAP